MNIRDIAIKIVCKFMCKNVSEVPLQFSYFAHIIRILSLALMTSEEILIRTIIRDTKNIFGLGFDGTFMLIPLYLKQIKEILNFKSNFDSISKSSAISILASLICIPDQYPNYIIPSVIKGVDEMSMIEVKSSVLNLIWLFIKESNMEADTTKKGLDKAISKGICCSFLIIHQEASKPNPQIDFIKVSLHSYIETYNDRTRNISWKFYIYPYL